MQAIRSEGVALATNGQYASLLAVIALSNVLKQPIRSLYPNVNYKLRDMFHQKIVPFNVDNETSLAILWSRMKSLDNRKNTWFIPNHFTPVVER